MSKFDRKIDFVVLLSVNKANSNGDPLNGNRPRQDFNGFGEISDVCIKRKIRNRMQDMGQPIFVQSDDRCDDGAESLNKRAELAGFKAIKTEAEFHKKACETWMDVRAFGQVFAFNNLGVKSLGVRGPVSIHQAVSVSPIEIEEMQITKSVSGERKSSETRGSDTMGMKYFVKFGLYVVKGSINVQLAEKTGFSQEDADIVKECLRTLFVNDCSAARPEGSMEVVRLYWWQHNCKEGQYPSAKVHRSIHITQKEAVDLPTSADDYEVILDSLPGLEPEIIEGI